MCVECGNVSEPGALCAECGCEPQSHRGTEIKALEKVSSESRCLRGKLNPDERLHCFGKYGYADGFSFGFSQGVLEKLELCRLGTCERVADCKFRTDRTLWERWFAVGLVDGYDRYQKQHGVGRWIWRER